MVAKFSICMLLVVLVSSAVHGARLRRPQEKEKTYNFLYKRFLGPITLEPTTVPPVSSQICCKGGCKNCPGSEPYGCCTKRFCVDCFVGYECCLKQ